MLRSSIEICQYFIVLMALTIPSFLPILKYFDWAVLVYSKNLRNGNYFSRNLRLIFSKRKCTLVQETSKPDFCEVSCQKIPNPLSV